GGDWGSARGVTGAPRGTRGVTGAQLLLLVCGDTELMRRVRRFQIAQYKCLVIKYAKDTRYCANGVSTHDSSQTLWSSARQWPMQGRR
uniref:Thymidine kinase, cytosolic n=1 Tax=Terrapene triunguis TaxID=2587831 RepID=A0A674JC38_9SAUR